MSTVELSDFQGSFKKDDYYEVFEKYFRPIVDSGEPYLFPSGYLGTDPRSLDLQQWVSVPRPALVDYYTDAGANMVPYKTPIVRLLSSWDNFDYSFNEVTLCHSVTIGSFMVLSVLRDIGVKAVIFETPAYYATMYQAEQLRLPFIRYPTYFRDRFRLDLSPGVLQKHRPCALWITQPRIALGIDQARDQLHHTLSLLREGDYLVIDEATEQRFPSTLHWLTVRARGCAVLKIRSLLKGMGLNGTRISAVIHPKEFKKHLDLVVWLYQGGLDVYSLSVARELAQAPARFQLMLQIAREQTVDLRQALDGLAAGSDVSLSPLTNGYIGCAAVAYPRDKAIGSSREALLLFLAHNRVVATLGASMLFAFDRDREFLRLNYFLPRHVLENSIRTIMRFSREKTGAPARST